MTRADRMLLLGLVVLAVLSAPVAAIATRGSESAIISGPYGTTAVDLTRDATYVVDGRCGRVTFSVDGGRLSCVGAECPDHICVKSGWLRPGAPIVCAPNGVVAAFDSAPGQGGALDAVSR